MLIKNIMWDYAGRFSLLFANLAVMSVLSRILSPAEYGTVGIVVAISGLASIILEFGFNSAIIQKSELEEVHLSTIFYLVLMGSVAIYGIVFFLSPVIADFYRIPEITAMLRVSALSFIVNAWNLVPSALITRNMMFKEQSIRNVGLTVLVGVVAIGLAFMGWGAWALVFQTLLSTFILVLVNVWLTKWRPRRLFNLAAITQMFHYSKYLFFSGAMDAVFTRLDALLIGKALNVQSVGFYSRARGMENMVQGVTTSSLNAVMFPYFSKMQEDEAQIISLFYRFFNIIATVIFLFTGLAYINAPWLFDLLFGQQWRISAGYYRIMALSAFAFPLSALMLSVVSARGNSKDFFKAEIGKKLIFAPVFGLIFWSLDAFLYAWVLALFIAFGINLHFLTKSIAIRPWTYWQIVLKFTFVLACFLFIYHVVMPFLGLSDYAFFPAVLFSIIFVLYFAAGVYFIAPEPFNLARQQFFQLKNQIQGRLAAR